jgi:hypothetical protein
MSAHFQQVLSQVRQWALSAQSDGWLSVSDVEPLLDLGDRTPAALFDAGVHRPLVVAFFGGTGVGKSSLLNRLAGQDVAKVGVERPTSREVSLYAHESVQLRQLPDGMPLERVRFAHHRDEQRRQVMWVDMPDIDSVATENRELVIHWLPHVDVLIYVVSPERYRDDKGWHLLREQGGSHAWLFVLNQWDRGCQEQLDDFRALLRQGGFPDPILLRTSCRAASRPRVDDEFGELESVIQELADQHVVEQLELRTLALRQQELQACVTACLQRLGSAEEWERLKQLWLSIWKGSEEVLLKGLEWPIREMSQSYVRRESNPLQKSIRLDSTESAHPSRHHSALWDDWAAMQLDDALNRLVLESECMAVSSKLRCALDAMADRAARHVQSRAQLCLRQALANPGNSFQRFCLRFTGLAALLLPLFAIGWVSWQAVTAYYASGQTHAGYLGVDFAVHSIILIVIAWLLPFFLNHQLRPSTERVAARGLRLGIEQGLALIEDDVVRVLTELQEEGSSHASAVRALMADAAAEPVATADHGDLLGRMLPVPQTTG